MKQSSKVYWFPKAGITKYHKLGDFKKQKLILLQLWNAQAWHQGANIDSSFERLWLRVYHVTPF